MLCEQPSCRGRPEWSLYLFMASHRHGLCEGPRVGEDPGVPLSRGCEGGPQAPVGAALRTRVVLGITASSHRECICARSPLVCSQGMYMCSLKGPFCNVCRARGPSPGGPGGWFLCPLAMAHCRLAGGSAAQHRWCLGVHTGCVHSGRKAPGNDQALCHRVPGDDQTLCLRGLGGPKLFIRAHPLVRRTRILSGTRGEARGCWEESPKEVGCWCLLWRAFFSLPTWT